MDDKKEEFEKEFEKQFDNLYKIIKKEGLDNFISNGNLNELIRKNPLNKEKSDPSKNETSKLSIEDINEQLNTLLKEFLKLSELKGTELDDSDLNEKMENVSNKMIKLEELKKTLNNSDINKSNNSLQQEKENISIEDINEEKSKELELNNSDINESNNSLEKEKEFNLLNEEHIIICQYLVAIDSVDVDSNVNGCIRKLNEKYLKESTSESNKVIDIINIIYKSNFLDNDRLKKIISLFPEIKISSDFLTSLIENDDTKNLD